MRTANNEADRVAEYGRLLALHESMFNNSEEAIIWFDQQGLIFKANPQFYRIFGYEPDDVVGRVINSVMGAGEKGTDDLLSRIAKGEKGAFELLTNAVGGRSVHVSVRFGPLSYEDIFAGGYAVISDITEDKQKEADLREREVWLRTLISKARMGIVIIDQEHSVMEANDCFAEMLGYSQEELLQLHTWDWEAELTEEDVRREFGDLSQINRHFETRYKRKDGTIIDVEISATGTGINGYNAVICICRDISDRKRAEKALRESEAKFRNYVENASDIIFTINTAGIITYVSPNIKKLRGFDKTEVEGRAASEFDHPEDADRLQKYIAKLFRHGQVTKAVEYRARHKDGSWHWYALNGSKTVDENNEPVLICIARNITDKKEYEEQLKFLSLHDQLTGLYNRYYFEKELERLAKGREYPISLLCCDLNRLKVVNDTLGHPAGDALLRTCAGLLKNSLRGGDIVARVGGDEFAAILLKTTEETAAAVVTRIYDNVNSYNENNPSFPISISIGLATAKDNKRPLLQVYKDADEKMYTVKNRYRKCRSILANPKDS